MKRSFTWILGGLTALALSVQGCSDSNALLDQNTEISNNNWSYVNRVKFDVKIEDDTLPYNLFMNLRVSGSYRYANLYTIVSQTNPGKKPEKTRYQFTLALPDGQWLGSGSGNLYSYRFPLRTHYRFPAKGIYHFEIEQNMRDNPLHEVSDIGLRVEKAK